MAEIKQELHRDEESKKLIGELQILLDKEREDRQIEKEVFEGEKKELEIEVERQRQEKEEREEEAKIEMQRLTDEVSFNHNYYY